MTFGSETGITQNMMTSRSPDTIRLMFQQFAIYLRTKRRIQSTTIDQYVSHPW